MSDFGRYGGMENQERERRWRDDDRGRGSIFSSDRESRDFDRGGERDFFSGRRESNFDRPDRERGFMPTRGDDFTRRDQPREQWQRDNQPGRESGGLFGSGRDDREKDDGGRREREREASRFHNEDHRRSLPINETEQLIASNKVEGTPVYGREGERLGTIYNFMVDKYSGRVTYAVMSYGGFLGVGQRYYPLPWRILSYDTNEGGYRVDLDARDMERAPSFSRSDEPRFNRDYGRRVHSWYGLDY